MSETRNEIKMLAERIALPQVRSWLRLHPAGFYELYPSRRVNNVYFDTPGLASFEENLSGVAARVKLRLRWYGSELSDVRCTVEMKCKQALDGWKVSHKLETPLDLKSQSWAQIAQVLRSELPETMRLRLDFANRPVLINRYTRAYQQSADGTVRVTVDSDQEVFAQRVTGRPNISNTVPLRDMVIVEAKANHSDIMRLADIVSAFPLRVCKVSKYVQGVEAILGH